MPIGTFNFLNTKMIDDDKNILYLDNSDKLNFRDDNGIGTIVASNLELENVNELEKNEYNTQVEPIFDSFKFNIKLNNFTLNNNSYTEINNNIVSKTSGGSGGWTRNNNIGIVYSSELTSPGYAYLKAKLLKITNLFIGFSKQLQNNTIASDALQYGTLDFSFHTNGEPSLYIYEKDGINNWTKRFHPYSVNDIIEIIYEKGTVKYYQNGTLKYTSLVSITSNETFYLNSSFYNQENDLIEILEFSSKPYIEIPSHKAPQLANSDFTIEFWAKINSITSDTIFIQGNNADHEQIQIYINSSNIYLNFNSGQAEFNHTSLNINNWNHFAIVFDNSGESNNGSAVCYFNGIQQNTTYWNGGPGMKGPTSASGNIILGDYPEFSSKFDGELKHLRIYNSIKYTSNFTVDTINHTVIDNIYLTEKILSEGKSNLDINLLFYAPMNNTSYYYYNDIIYNLDLTTSNEYFTFNGISNYIVIPSHKAPQLAGSNFTIEFWAKLEFPTDTTVIFHQGVWTAGLGKMLSVYYHPTNRIYLDFHARHIYLDVSSYYNVWTHYTFTFDSSDTNYLTAAKIFVNGVQQNVGHYSTTSGYKITDGTIASGSIYIGSRDTYDLYYKGELKHLRVYNSVKYNSDFNVDLDNNITLESLNEYNLNDLNNYFKFNGISDYIEIPANQAPQLAGSNFTIEFWFKPITIDNNYSTIYSQGTWGTDGGNISIFLYENDTYYKIQLDWHNGYTNIHISNTTHTTKTQLLNNWNHLAIIYNASNPNNRTFYLNGHNYNITEGVHDTAGVSTQGGTHINNQTTASGKVLIGVLGNPTPMLNSYFNGELKHLRVYNTVKYNSNFTVDSTNHTITSNQYSITLDSNFLLYIPMNNHNLYNYDGSNTIINAVSNRLFTFNGTSDYIEIPANDAPQLAGSNFTIEFWLYVDSLTAYNEIYNQGWGTNYNSISIVIYPSGNNYYIQCDFYNSYSQVSIPKTQIDSQWNHFVWSFDTSGPTRTHYFNGVLQSIVDNTVKGANPNAQTTASGKVLIGKNVNNIYPFNGQLKHLRVYNTVKYSSNFTVDSTNHTITSNPYSTTLDSDLLLYIFIDDYSYDRSNDNNTITNTITPITQFNGTSDYIEIPANKAPQLANSNFTIEFWFKPITIDNNYSTIYSQGTWGTDGGNISILLYEHNTYYKIQLDWHNGYTNIHISNTTHTTKTQLLNNWNHLAIIYNASNPDNRIFYLNGHNYNIPEGVHDTAGVSTQGGTHINQQTTASGKVLIGVLGNPTPMLNTYFDGELKHLRVYNSIKYTGNFNLNIDSTNHTITSNPYSTTLNSDLLLYFPNIDSNFYNYNKTIYLISNPLLSFNVIKSDDEFIFNGISDYIEIPANEAPQLANSDFTIEFWAKLAPPTNTSVIFHQGNWAVNYSHGSMISIYYNTANNLYFDFHARYIGQISVSSYYNVWTHYAFTFDNSGTDYKKVAKIFINGIEQNSAHYYDIVVSELNKMIYGTKAFGPIYLGKRDTDDLYYKGQLKNLRVYNSIKYNSDFSVNLTNHTITDYPYSLTLDKTLLYIPMNNNNYFTSLRSLLYIPMDNSSSLYNYNGNNTVIDYFNNISYNIDLLSDQHYTFNGTSDYIEIPANQAPQLANSDFTIEFWAKINNLTLNYYHIVYQQGPSDYYHNLCLYFRYDGTNSSLTLDFYGGGVSVTINNINFNDWNHYAIVFDNSIEPYSLWKATKFYINGYLHDTTGPQHTDRRIISSGRVIIGKDDNSNVDHFDGELKHLRVYNSVKYSSNFSVNALYHTVNENDYLTKYQLTENVMDKNIFTLVSKNNNITITNHVISKTAGVSSWNNGFVHSQESYTGSAYIKIKVLRTDSSLFVGLHKDPFSNHSNNDYYFDLDYSIHINQIPSLYAYELNNQQKINYGSYSVGDILELIYSGNTVKYYQNGNLYYTSTNVPVNETFYLDSVYYFQNNNQIEILEFSKEPNNNIKLFNTELLLNIDYNTFNGTSDYIEIPSNEAPQLAKSDFTIEFWAKLQTTTSYREIYSQGNTDVYNNYLTVSYGNGTNNEIMKLDFHWDAIGWDISSYLNIWNHYAVTYDTTYNTNQDIAKLYINGTFIHATEYKNNIKNGTNASGFVRIGRNSNSSGDYYLQGDLKQLRVYNSVKYNRYKTPKSFTLIANDSNIRIINNILTKIDGGTGWNASVHSNESYTSSAYIKVKILTVSNKVMVGFNTDPTTDSSYSSIDFALYFDMGSLIYYKSGWPTETFSQNYYQNDIIEMLYLGTMIYLYHNGNLFFIITENVPANSTFYLDTSIHYERTDNAIEILEFSDIIPDFNVDLVNHTVIDNPFLTENSLLETSITLRENNFTLISNDDNTTINNNVITKISGGNTWSNGNVNSEESYTGSTYIKFEILHTNTNHTYIGLTTNSSISSYNDLNYSIYCNYGSLYINGNDYGTYSLNDIFEIIYEGTTIKFYKNTVLFYLTSSSYLTFYLGVSIYYGNNAQSVEILEFSSVLNNNVITNNLEIINTSNNSFTFNGTSDYLEIPGNIAPQLSNSNFTIEFWAKIDFDGLSENDAFILYQDYFLSENNNIIIYARKSTKRLFFDFGKTWWLYVELADYNNIMTHYTITWDNTTLTFYVNGVLKQTYTQSGSGSPAILSNGTKASGPMMIGKNIPGYNNYFKGELKHLRVYNSVKYNSNFNVDVNLINHTIINNPYSTTSLDEDLLLYIPMDNNKKIYTPLLTELLSIPMNNISFNFDGTNDYIEIPANKAPQLANSDFTIEFWAKLEPQSQIASIFLQGKTRSYQTGQRNILEINLNQSTTSSNPTEQIWYNTLQMLIYDNTHISGTGTGVRYHRMKVTSYYGIWTHYALTFNSSDTSFKWYINGIVQDTTDPDHNTVSSSVVLTSSGSIYIGKRVYEDNNEDTFFSGELKHLRVYNSVKYNSNFNVDTLNQIVNSNLYLTSSYDEELLLYMPMTNTNYYLSSLLSLLLFMPMNTNYDYYSNNKFLPLHMDINTSNNSFTFNGISDYIEIEENIAPQLTKLDFTIEFWVKITSGSYPAIFSQGNRTSAGHDIIEIYFHIPNKILYMNFSEGRAEFDVSTLINDSTIYNWNHFAIVYDSSGFSNMGSALCYINGNSITTNYWNDSNTHLGGMKGQTNASGKIILGDNLESTNKFDGELKHLRIYDSIKYTSNFTVNKFNNYSYNVIINGLQNNMTGLQIRTNTFDSNYDSVTALGRTTTTSGQGTITISNDIYYNRIKGYFKVRAGGSTDGFNSNSQSITGTTFMDGVAITGFDSSNNESWIYGIPANNYDANLNIANKPSFVGDHYTSYLSNHAKPIWDAGRSGEGYKWFNYNDANGVTPYKIVLFDRILPNTFQGNIKIRIMSNQSNGNEDLGIEEYNLSLYNEIINNTDTVISNPYSSTLNSDLLLYIPMTNKQNIIYHNNNNNTLSNNNTLYSYQNELYFENGKVITENSHTGPLKFNNNYVGIGTANPQYPLHVTGSKGNMPSMKYFVSGITDIRSGSNDSITIYAESKIYASGVVAASDYRIKTNIEQLVDNEALIKFRQLKPCKYNYIDTVTRTSEKVYGFIAQEVRETLPYAISITEEYIPNIYKLALYKDTVITFDNEHNLESKGKIKLIKPNNTKVIVPYVIIDTHKINIIISDLSSDEILSNDLVQDEDGNDLAHNIFVYGTNVNNFHTLNKNAIWTTATAALQEVDKIQQSNKIRINNLESENIELKDKVSTLENNILTLKTKLSDIINKITILKNN